MITPKIENLLVKYLNKSANSEDLDKLNAWVKNPDNQLDFKKFIKTHFVITLGMNNPNPDRIKENLLKEIQKDKFHISKIKPFFKYAAIAIIFLGLGYLFKLDMFHNYSNETLVPKEESVTLELEDGTIEVISKDSATKVFNTDGKIIASQKGEKLVYEKDQSINKLVYNTLRVPYGKRFDIVLSDGTQVFLNSGSSIKYPVRFLKGKNRQVSVSGEAFLHVTKDKVHPFIVDTKGINVKVYGTKFNVAAYPEDNETDIILVEGSVAIRPLDTNTLENIPEVFLTPGTQGSYNNRERTISTKNVNTSIYTSWINGTVVFRNETFDNIITKLERHYNITIINNNTDLAKETFNASIEVENETIEDVLDYFNKVYDIEFSIVQNKVIIYKP